MLEGVNLLYSYTAEVNPWIKWALWIGLAIMAVITLYMWFLAANRQTKSHVVVAIICSLLAIGLMITAFEVDTSKETLHKVTIDYDVSFVEFTYYYEVVNIEGDIYTIREIVQAVPDTIPPAPTETVPTTDPTWSTDAVG
jgi:hypothetical protein